MLIFYYENHDYLCIYYYDEQNRLVFTQEHPRSAEWITMLSAYKDFDAVIAQSNSTLIHREDV